MSWGGCLLAGILFGVGAQANAWTSARVYPSGSGLAYTYDAEGTRIPDFSYAGYEEGCKPLPGVIPVVATLTPVVGDNTTNINNALLAVAALPVQANGYRGALLLQPGTYNVGGVVRVGGNGVVLRGSGSGTNPAVDSILYSTRTDFDAGNNRGEYSVVILGNIPYSNNGLRAVGSSVDITTAWVKVGDASFQVSDVGPFAVGDRVVISQPISAAWLATVDGGGCASAPDWTASGNLVQERRIVAIDTPSKTLTVNGGSFQHLKRSLGQCTVALMAPERFAQHSGIEDLRVDITHSSMTDEHHAKNAIMVNQAMHCWVRNTASRYYWHSAVMVQSSLYCSIDGNTGSNFAGIVTGERGYTFSAEGNSSRILFTRNKAYGGRHNYICNSGFTNSGVVFYDNDSYNSLSTIEAHMHWSMGILFDNMRDYNSSSSVAMGVYNRGDYGTNHGWACANCVLWNSLEEDQNIIVQKPPTAQNYAIGCTAGKSITGAKPPAPFSQPTGWVEGANTPGLVPASLYAAQLAARTDCSFAGTPTPTRTRSRTATVSATASRTATLSFSPSKTLTGTATPTRSSTPTSPQSPSFSASPTRSQSPSATLSPSRSDSPSSTLTMTPTLSQTPSSTSSLTPKPSAASSGTLTATLSSSITTSATLRATDMPSMTITRTPSSTVSATRTVTSTRSVTRIASGTASASVTMSSTPSYSATVSASPTPSGTEFSPATASATPTESIASTPIANSTVSIAAGPGPLVIRRILPLPNPNPQYLWVELEGPAERLRISLYSVGLTKVLVRESGPFSAGGHQLSLPEAYESLAAGTYYLRIEAIAAGRLAQSRACKFLRLR